VNPFGVIFNPVALETLVLRALNAREFTASDLDKRDDIWFCYETHTCLSGLNQDEVLTNLNGALSDLNLALSSAKHLILTLGTAWAYRLKQTDRIVANCHKQPSDRFSKELLSPAQIEASLRNLSAAIKKVNPELTIIYTVSPVRHIKDGIVANARSKAHLLSGVHALVDADANTHYFPAYELMIDELRDYRYYSADLIHPNQEAIDYIWERFSEVWISPEAQKLNATIGKLRAAMNHRSQFPGSKADTDFKRNLQERLSAFKAAHPHIKL
jgi:lysophospholipase L1-like esterase